MRARDYGFRGFEAGPCGPRLWWPAGLAAAVLVGTLLMITLLFVAPAAAQAADFEFKGRGYGHGVGMSQWGAWAAAKDGRSFEWIMDFYYPGTELVALEDPNVELRVKLSSEPWRSVYSIAQDFEQVDLRAVGGTLTIVKHTASGNETETITEGAFASTFRAGDGVEVGTGSGRRGPYEWVEVRPADGGRVGVQMRTESGVMKPREYWGSVRVDPSSASGFVNAFNLVPIDRYLRSIAEVPYDWAQSGSEYYAPEAVKAQAVAARTYAVANREPYLDDNQWDQVYLGYTGRSKPDETPFEKRYPGIPRAAEETAGLVLEHEGSVITSFFSSSSGGYTSAWDPDRYPYLPAKPDPYSLEGPPYDPGFEWDCTISQDVVSEKANGMTDAEGLEVSVGTVERMEIVSRDAEDTASHASRLRVVGSEGTALVDASSFRRLFGYSVMRSTLILEIRNPDGSVSTGPSYSAGDGGDEEGDEEGDEDVDEESDEDGDAAADERESLEPGEFYDVPATHRYYEEIKRAALSELASGYENGDFGPEDVVSRWQFAKMAVGLHNSLFPEDQIEVVNVDTAPFWDVAVRSDEEGDESDWVAAAKKAGLVEGVGERHFKPYEPVRRDQMASMLVRALDWTEEAEAVSSEIPRFADIPEDSPHAAASTHLRSLDILRGYQDPADSGTYVLQAGEPTKRMHVAVILCRVLDL